eukprot:5188012-Pyramimonas_sp.AAC.1
MAGATTNTTRYKSEEEGDDDDKKVGPKDAPCTLGLLWRHARIVRAGILRLSAQIVQGCAVAQKRFIPLKGGGL